MATIRGDQAGAVPRRKRAIIFTVAIDLPTVLRWVVGLLFVAASVSKLANPTVFLGDVLAYQLPLPELWLRIGAMAMPWMELLCGLLLLANLWTESAITMVLALFVFFLAITGQAWVRHLDISCGCFNLRAFGLSEDTARLLESTRIAFFRNLAFTGVMVYLLRDALIALKARHGQE